jgi:hypothetical protein
MAKRVCLGQIRTNVVIAYVKQLVDGGKAAWRRLSNGDIELCLASGELFLLGEENITRLS